METLNAIVAVVVLIGAFLGAVKAALKEWSEIQKLLRELKKLRKRKKDGSHRRKR